MKSLFSTLFIVTFLPLSAQVADSFDDSDFTTNPGWISSDVSGNGSDFQVVGQEVQSAGPAASATIWLSTENVPDLAGNEITWEFYVRYEQAPSSSNNVEIYLNSETGDLSDNPTGYFVRLGESGSDDGIDLYKTSSSTPLISDPNPTVFDGINARIRVVRDDQGNFSLYADPTGGTSFSLIGSTQDIEFVTGTYFGFKVEHSSTRNESFFFDDVSISSVNTDNTPPEVVTTEFIEPNQISVTFNEQVEPISAATIANYELLQIGHPEEAEVVAVNEVLLSFNNLTSGNYTLAVENVEDISGNAIGLEEVELTIFVPDIPEFRDVLITEIMADPTPAVNLPEVEYLELYNASSKTFDLNSWRLSDATNEVSLVTYIFEPGTLLILTATGNAGMFNGISVLEVSGFPTLNNNSDIISLKFSDDALIDQVSYSSDWYQDEDKSNGGFSLELINENDVCGGAQNWSASVDDNGGTPGLENSIWNPAPGGEIPEIVDAEVISSTKLQIRLSKPIDTLSFDAENITVSSRNVIDYAYEELLIVIDIDEAFQAEEFYLVAINGQDCTGNTFELKTEVQFIVNPTLAWKDVIITEIMANPNEETTLPNFEYVELYNRSGSILNLKDFIFADQTSAIALPSYLIGSNEFVVLTEGEEFGTNTITVSRLPSLNNTSDILYLSSADSIVVDSISYTSSWYQNAVKADGGYSLELIDENNICGGASNWLASNAESGGTPGAVNSIWDPDAGNQLPEILAIDVIDQTKILVTLSEPIDKNSFDDSDVWISSRTIQKIEIAEEEVTLTVGTPFESGNNYQVLFTGSDCTGNAFETSETFTYITNPPLQWKDLVITEIMANPNEETILPNFEYVEFLNRTNTTLNLKDFVFADKSTSIVLPTYLLSPGEYVIITEGSIQDFGDKTLTVENLPSLNNSEDNLYLFSNTDEIIDSVTYTSSWYRSSIKDDGGFSLEIIDPDNFCSGDLNWIATEDDAGGTPGVQNSVFSKMQDNMGPRIISAVGIDSKRVSVTFNEVLDEESALSAAYTISNDIVIEDVNLISLSQVELILATDLMSGVSYSLTIENITDCPGNLIDDDFQTVAFSLVEEADTGDIVLNELLFNPRSGGVDFVEVYNRSAKFIKLDDWKLANAEIQADSLALGTIRSLPETNIIIAPNSYLAFTSDVLILQNEYPKAAVANLIELNSLPSYPDDAGVVVLLNQSEIRQDFYAYNEDQHAAIIDDPEGVSLEKISPDTVTNTPENWFSASAGENFATPGYQNSQYSLGLDASATIDITPRTFVPDGDGMDDFTTISYNFPQTGSVLNVYIFNVSGQLVKTLVRNDFTSASGFYTWDGSDDSNNLLPTGYYIVLIEAFDAQGNSQKIKEKVVLGSRF